MFTKDEIIKELQNYTKENGGKTPSEEKFYKNTEIVMNDRAKYWSNYGELVVEARLTPNKFDNTKYDRNQLCEMFIQIIREKGKWPTRGALDVKHHNDSSFPYSSTFYKKLGLTSNLARTIFNFIKDKQNYNDITDICNIAIEKYKDQDTTNEDMGLINGFVYLGKQHGSYKIGHTKDTIRRREDITLLGSEPFESVHEIKTDDMNGVEKYWHNRFKSKLKRGEWFNLSVADVKAFKSWKKII